MADHGFYLGEGKDFSKEYWIYISIKVYIDLLQQKMNILIGINNKLIRYSYICIKLKF